MAGSERLPESLDNIQVLYSFPTQERTVQVAWCDLLSVTEFGGPSAAKQMEFVSKNTVPLSLCSEISRENPSVADVS